MGIHRASTKHTADFTGIAADQRLYVSHIAHGVDLTVDEQGAEAAAAAAAVVTDISFSLAHLRPVLSRAVRP